MNGDEVRERQRTTVGAHFPLTSHEAGIAPATLPSSEEALDETSGAQASFWLETTARPLFEPLTESLRTDVVVIGAGIAGLSVAYNLLQSGRQVVVLEDGEIGSGETGRTSAHLSNVLDDRYFVLEKYHGLEGAKLACESHAAAIDWIEACCTREAIRCDFQRVDGYLIASPGDDDVLQKEFDAARRAGLHMEWETNAPWPGFDTGRCLRFSRQAQFDPMAYLAGLAKSVVRWGGRIFTHTHATTVSGKDPAYVLTQKGLRVEATAVVVATNVPIHERLAIHTKQAAYRTYMIAAPLPLGRLAPALFWDTEDPYHYVRTTPGRTAQEQWILIGGEDHKTGQPPALNDPYERLEAWARRRFPQMEQVTYRWSGQIIEPNDGLAFIGASPGGPSNVYLVTGDSGNGLTHGTIAGMLIADLIAGRKNPWSSLYSPQRISVAAAGDFVKENVNTAAQYVDWLTPGEAPVTDFLARGSGRVVRHGLEKMAVYRDPHGALHAMSAVCPHLGALVHWNDKEKTWDCPAHGSRFSPMGHVLNGPANAPLTPAEEDRAPSAVTNGQSAR